MEAPHGKEYAGPSGVGRDSIWLTAEDLIEGQDATVKIERVMFYPEVTFQGGRKRTNMLGLKFVGKQRILGLNATNRKVLNQMFGNITAGWKNKEITLYVGEAQIGGETVKAVRVRNRGSRAASAAEQFLDGGDVEQAAGDPGEPAPKAAAPQSGTKQDFKAMFTEGTRVLGLSMKDSAAILNKHQGDYEAAYRELNETEGEGSE